MLKRSSLILLTAATSLFLITGTALASHKRVRAYNWAHKRIGHSYCMGGTGPGCYDCSGLVMKAYNYAGMSLPRTTTEMMNSSKVYRISPSNVREGDLAFYGSGHVELYSSARKTLGAENQGVHVYSWAYGYGWNPTAYYRVKGANYQYHG